MNTERLISSAVVILIAVIMIGVINGLTRAYLKRHVDMDIKVRATIKLILEMVDIVIVFITILTVLAVNNINVSSMVTGAGIITAIAGLAMQDMLKDVIMGIHIINDKAFTVGDVIKVNGDEGQVIYFSLLTTKIRSIDTWDIVTICNRDITQIAKSSGSYGILIPMSYEADPAEVSRVFTACAEEVSRIEGIDCAIFQGISDYEASSVLYRLRYDCSPTEKWPMKRAVLAVVQKYVIESGLEIPFQQIVVRNCD